MSLKSLFYSEKFEIFLNKYKILVYLFFSLTFIFILLFFNSKIQNEEKEYQLTQLTKIVNKFEKKDKNIDLLITITSLEKYLKDNLVKVISMKLMDKGFSLNLEGKYKETMKMVDFIEKKSSLLKIEKLNVNYDKRKKLTNLFLDVKVLKKEKIYKKQNNKNLQIANVFDEKSYIKPSNIENKANNSKLLRLYAIVEDMVNLNNKWFKIGEEIDKKRIVYIGDDFIKLKSDDKLFTLGIYEDEFIR